MPTSPLSQLYSTFLLDCDGVVYLGTEVIPAAHDTYYRLSDESRVWFVTNNAFATSEQVALRLQKLGIQASSDQIQTSARATAQLMQSELPGGAKILALGGPGLQHELVAAGFDLVADHTAVPAAVVHGFNPENSWQGITELCYAIGQGAQYYATNLDSNMPDHIGLAPGNGALAEAIRTAIGAQPRIGGKPEALIYEQLIEDSARTTTLAVGDRLDTDIVGANRAGIDSLAVLSGVVGPIMLLEASEEFRPTHIGHDLSALLEPALISEPITHGWRCGETLLHVTDTGVEFIGPDNTLQALWVSCQYAWHANPTEAGYAQIRQHWQRLGKPVQ